VQTRGGERSAGQDRARSAGVPRWLGAAVVGGANVDWSDAVPRVRGEARQCEPTPGGHDRAPDEREEHQRLRPVGGHGPVHLQGRVDLVGPHQITRVQQPAVLLVEGEPRQNDRAERGQNYLIKVASRSPDASLDLAVRRMIVAIRLPRQHGQLMWRPNSRSRQ
jgi:hypothetical protein